MCEPRGHKDMVGALLVEPISKEADIGVIYMDANRWINMCGHATIGVSMTLVNENLVKVVEPVTHLTLIYLCYTYMQVLHKFLYHMGNDQSCLLH